MSRALLLTLGLAAAAAAALPVSPAAAALPVGDGAVSCVEEPEPARWLDAGTADPPRADLVIAAHRGAAKLAPENTLWAYRYAIAYGVEMIEVDVQQTRDGRFVSFHDSAVDAKTDGSGSIETMSYEEVRKLNAADNDRWRGSEYDPARIPSLVEILELARETDAGIYFDIKGSVRDLPGLVALARRFGVVERSAFLAYDPARSAAISALAPEAALMLSNPDGSVPPAALYGLTAQYTWFGSSLPKYSAEKVAAIHDGCGLVIPNVYQGHVSGSEAGDLLFARGIGVDGAQVNTPELVADVLDEPVETGIDVRRAEAEGAAACLLSSAHGIGLPDKSLERGGEEALETAKGGCAGFVPRRRGRLVFDGDGSALASCVVFRSTAREADGFAERPCRKTAAWRGR